MLLAAYYNIVIIPVECPNMNMMGVAVRILFPAGVEQEIHYALKLFTLFIYNFRFSAAILANWRVVILI